MDPHIWYLAISAGALHCAGVRIACSTRSVCAGLHLHWSPDLVYIWPQVLKISVLIYKPNLPKAVLYIAGLLARPKKLILQYCTSWHILAYLALRKSELTFKPCGRQVYLYFPWGRIIERRSLELSATHTWWYPCVRSITYLLQFCLLIRSFIRSV